MQAKKDTLFSIKNEALKKERKYALWVMRAIFVLEILWSIFILFLLGYFFSDTTFSNAILPTYNGYLPVTLGIPLIISLLILWFLWKLQFLGCYLLGAMLILSSLNTVFSVTSFIDVALPFTVGLFLFIASLRVHSFLREQADSPFIQKIDDVDNAEIIPVTSQPNDYEALNNYEVSKEVIENNPLDTPLRRNPLESNPLLFRIFFMLFMVVSLLFYMVMKLFSIMVGNILFILWLICLPFQAMFRYCKGIIEQFKNK